jgi:acetyltransferase-like isoleucine patch superfamily enzyme
MTRSISRKEAPREKDPRLGAMPFVHMPFRELKPLPEAERVFDRFLLDLEERLNIDAVDRNELVRTTLYEMYLGTPGDFERINDGALSLAARSMIACFDPRNVTLEPEYYANCDPDRYYPRKPLTWLWLMFDRSPLGMNAGLGHRFRRVLAPYIFKKVGENFKSWHWVEWSFGYNLTFGDNVVVHRNVLIDDRGEVIIGDDVSISDYANIYSHAHDIVEIDDVRTDTTTIGDRARVTYHATVLSGTRVGNDAMVGSFGVVTKPIPDYVIATGVPARPVSIKPNAPAELREAFEDREDTAVGRMRGNEMP